MGSSSRATLVTGGTGFLGAHIVRALLRRGERPRCLVRATSDRRNLEGLPVEIVDGDLTDVASLQRPTKGLASLFHCAADSPLSLRSPRQISSTNLTAPRPLLL